MEVLQNIDLPAALAVLGIRRDHLVCETILVVAKPSLMHSFVLFFPSKRFRYGISRGYNSSGQLNMIKIGVNVHIDKKKGFEVDDGRQSIVVLWLYLKFILQSLYCGIVFPSSSSHGSRALSILSQWQAIVYPLLLTALLYLGPLVMAALNSTSDSDEEEEAKVEAGFIQGLYTKITVDVWSMTTDIFSWRNYVVVRHRSLDLLHLSFRIGLIFWFEVLVCFVFLVVVVFLLKN